MKQIIMYVLEGWCSDDASWTQAFCSLVTFAVIFFVLSFLLCSWMMIVY